MYFSNKIKIITIICVQFGTMTFHIEGPLFSWKRGFTEVITEVIDPRDNIYSVNTELQ